MPIQDRHPLYNDRYPQWERCRDVTDGSDAVKKKGQKYLPRLSGQTNEEYNKYKQRALFYSASGRSLSGLVGMATRRTPKISASEAMKTNFIQIKNNGFGLSFPELLVGSIEEVLKTARYGIMLDWPTGGGQTYITTYLAESIINWDVDSNGVLSFVVLHETYYEVGKDKFERVPKTRYRHLSVIDNIYTVEIYSEKGEFVESIVPRVSGTALNFIPMVFVNPIGVGVELMKPPILDIVDVNISQYMSSADLEHGRHFTGLPTPVITGAPPETSLSIGSTTAWAITNDKAKVYYLEFQGLGLKSLENAIQEKTSQMAQFSSRLMDTSTRGSEAAETVRLRHSAEAATLSTVVQAVESAINIIYKWIADVEREEFESILLNKDFLDMKLTPAELKALTEAYISGAIDEETYYFNLERGEMVHPDKEVFDTKPTQNLPEVGNAT